jgi:hypothetical protein
MRSLVRSKGWMLQYSGKRLSEIQTKLCLAWFIAREIVPHTTAHRYSAILAADARAAIIKKSYKNLLSLFLYSQIKRQ